MLLTRNVPFWHFLKYNAVGVFGFSVRLAVLVVLTQECRLDYLVATALAVEAGMLHNFFWHSCWTWRERSTGITWRDTAQRLVQFQLTNGAVALAANLLSMRVLVGEVGLHYFPASVLAAAAGGIVNFLAAEFVIFRPQVFETAAPLVRGRS